MFKPTVQHMDSAVGIFSFHKFSYMAITDLAHFFLR